ncbi:MAG TPA: cytochrome c peroxidase [Chthoniobacterales bacterium]|nr:cytochrome c peroxidase [Chthoniobacterales bacterium]
MRRRPFALAMFLAWQAAARLSAQNGTLDLSTLENYANQGKPGYILKDNTPPGNPITDAGATLGRVLFYDKRLSRNNTVSCATCHQQAHGFSDSALASFGVGGTTARHSTRLPNARFGTEPHFFWDERAVTLEDQTTHPIKSVTEMGFSGTNGDPPFSSLLSRLAAIQEYQILFNFAFGSSTIDETRIQKALAQFVRSIQSFDSKYDAGRAAVPDPQPFPNFTASENNGKQLFLRPANQGGAGCAGCHRPPEFDIDPDSLNNGVIFAIGGGTDLTNTRSPSLRNLADSNGQLNGPFMHNGGFTSFAQVINHYAAIPGNNQNLDPRLRRPGGQVQVLNLTPQERLDIEAFLLTLSGTAVYLEPKWSNPFSASGTITLVNVPPGLSPTPTPTPAPLPAARSLNISSRLGAGAGDQAIIGGFIITGNISKTVLIRGLGPALTNFGLIGVLDDPMLELRRADGALLFQNDNWKDSQRALIEATPYAPGDDREPVLIATLDPGAYTAILSGKNQTTGVALLEIYDLDLAADAQLANISTRGFVGAQNNVMIGGFILGGDNGNTRVAIRGLGPSLAQFGLGNLLADPTLELHDSNGATLITNDNWSDDPAAAALLSASGLAPSSANESAIFTTLAPGQFTAILAGKNGSTGLGIVEVYNLR